MFQTAVRVVRIPRDEIECLAHDKCSVIGHQQVLLHLGEGLRLLPSRSTFGIPSVAGPPQAPCNIPAFRFLSGIYCIPDTEGTT